MHQIIVEVGAHLAGASGHSGQVADWNPKKPGEGLAENWFKLVCVTGGRADAVTAKDDDLLKRGAIIRRI